MTKAFLIATLMVLSAFVTPPVSSHPLVTYPTAPRMFVTTNVPFPVAGDNVSVDVYTYLGTNLADPDAPPVVRPFSGTSIVQIEGVARVGTGHYRGYADLPPSRPAGGLGFDNVVFYINATLAGAPIATDAGLTWITPGPYLEFFSDAVTITYGQMVHLKAELYDNASLVDADPGSVQFYPVTLSGPGASFAPNRTSVGVYEADLNWSATPFITWGAGANATYHGVRMNRIIHSTAVSNPPPAAFYFPRYQAWFHLISSTSTMVHGDLWVADDQGRPASGVPVSLTVSPTRVQILGTTNGSGALALDVNLSGGAAQVFGMVGGSSPLATAVYEAFPYTPCNAGVFLGSGPSVLALDPPLLADGNLRDYLTPGTSVTRRYQAVNPYAGYGNAPLPNVTLTYYIAGASTGQVYRTGNAMADGGGDFSLQFTVPNEDVVLLFDVTGVLSSRLGYSVASPLLGLHTGSLQLGGPTEVEPRFAGRGALYASAGEVLGVALIQVFSPAGERWDDMAPGQGCTFDFLRPSSVGMNATFHLPSFLPATAKYLVNIWAEGGAGVIEQHALLMAGQSADIPVAGGGTPASSIVLWTAIGAALAGIAALGVAWALLRRRRSPPSPPSEPPSRT